MSKKLKINSVPGKGRSDLSGMRKRKDTFHYTFVCLLRNKKTNVVFIAFHQRRSGSSCLWTIFVRSNISESKSVKIGFEWLGKKWERKWLWLERAHLVPIDKHFKNKKGTLKRSFSLMRKLQRYLIKGKRGGVNHKIFHIVHHDLHYDSFIASAV